MGAELFSGSRVVQWEQSCSVGAELFHADGEADITKLIVALRNVANAPKTVLEETLCHV